jgi:3-methyladenine DNA glycosylase AlkD
MSVTSDANAFADELESAFRRAGDPERAEGAQRYLKHDLPHFGVAAAPLRRSLREALQSYPVGGRADVLARARALWDRPVFELKAAAVELLTTEVEQLEARDLSLVERFLRAAGTWALVDGLASRVAGRLVEREPSLIGTVDRWASDEDFWLRRSALLVFLLPLRRGEGDFERFASYAEVMLEEREFFVRKAIGWVLREAGKKRPERVSRWLLPRAHRASSVTVREAVKYLPSRDREAILDRRRRSR